MNISPERLELEVIVGVTPRGSITLRNDTPDSFIFQVIKITAGC